MTPAEALARRWRLVDGMLIMKPWGDDLRADRMRVLSARPDGAYCVEETVDPGTALPDFWPAEILIAGWLPDLEDPATLGAIVFGLLPHGWSIGPTGNALGGGLVEWAVFDHECNVIADGLRSQPLAVVAALEAAPVRR